jgi:Spy/CpxP family protein refolding chaperone
MMKSTLLPALLSATLLLTAPLGHASPPMGSPAPADRQVFDPGFMAPFTGLEFSQRQREVIDRMMAEERKAHIERIDKMRQYQQELMALYRQDEVDINALGALHDKMSQEQRSYAVGMAKARNEIFRTLNDAQRQMMRERREAMERQMQERMKR